MPSSSIGASSRWGAQENVRPLRFPAQRDLELLSINLTAHNRLLRLHRPHLIKGLAGKDQTSVSARRCIDASKAILRILRHAKRVAPMLLKVRSWLLRCAGQFEMASELAHRPLTPNPADVDQRLLRLWSSRRCLPGALLRVGSGQRGSRGEACCSE